MTIKWAFAPVVDPATRLLVLGSLPGDRSLAEQRYYAHPQNQFWRLMSPVAGRDLVSLDYDARLAALLAAGVGLWDVVGSARRTGSGDAAIRDATGNDLTSLIARLPALRALAFNGGAAHRIGVRGLGAIDQQIALIALPSSSPLHTVGIARKQAAWTALKHYLDG